jgi:hypothetical protein
MTCRAATGFVFHDLAFAEPAPSGYAICRRCDNFISRDQFLEESCPASFGRAPEIVPLRPLPPGGLRCSLCGEPVHVDPMHRAVVEWFGATCDACFSQEVTDGRALYA